MFQKDYTMISTFTVQKEIIKTGQTQLSINFGKKEKIKRKQTFEQSLIKAGFQ